MNLVRCADIVFTYNEQDKLSTPACLAFHNRE
jgi:hypothetical protein